MLILPLLVTLAVTGPSPAVAVGAPTATKSVPKAVVAGVSHAVESGARASSGWRVTTWSELADRLTVDRARQLFGCSGPSCTSALATEADVSDLLTVNIERTHEGYSVTLARLNAQSGTPLSSQRLMLPLKAPDSGLEAVERAARALLPPVAMAVPAPAVALARPLSARRAIRVAMLEPRVEGEVPERVRAALRQSLPPELRKVEGVSVISEGEIADMLGLERQKQLVGCTESNCMAELAGALDANELVSIDIALVGATYAVASRRSNVLAAKVEQSYSVRVEKRDGEEILALVGPMIAALYPDRPLKLGHSRGVEAELIGRLNPPPLPRWVFIITASATGAAGIASGVSALLLRDAVQRHSALALSSTAGTVSGPDLVSVQRTIASRLSLTNALLITTGALAVVSIIEALFTDWHGDRAALAPLPLADGAGVAASFTF